MTRTTNARALLGEWLGRAALAGLLLAATASPAEAWSCITGACPKWCGTAQYFIGACSADLDRATCETEVRRGMDDWQFRACSGLVTNYAGMTSAVPGRYEGTPTIGWIESGWRHGSSAIGVTGPQWDGRNCIREADMEMNGQNYTWITGSGRGNNVNTYSITLHEGGHYYGLGHSTISSAAMFGAYTGGIDMITADDENGICTLYPGDGMPPPDCTETGCPAGQECVGGSCRPITGDGSVCSVCMNSGDCGGPADFCLMYPDGVGYCGRACNSAADCGSDVCADLGGTRQCIRVDGRTPDCSSGPMLECTSDTDCEPSERCNASGACEPRPTDRAGLGEPCETSDDCNSDLCFAGVCSSTCDWLDVTSCPSGFFCDGTATGSCGSGLCLAGGAGSTAYGGRCTEHTDCNTLLCAEGTCSIPCTPMGAVEGACPAGSACQVGVIPTCGACKEVGRTGDECDSNEDCASRLCAETSDGRTFCTEVCADNADCPSGYACTDAGGTSVCVPPLDGMIPPGAVGADCMDNAECDSRLCAVLEDDTFCTEECGSDVDCPAGFECVSAGSISVCSPIAGGGGGGCGCAAPGRAAGDGAPVALALVGLLAFGLRRRRGSRST